MLDSGAKRKGDKRAEWMAAFEDIDSWLITGIPQDESVVWLNFNTLKIRCRFLKRGHDVSEYIVKQLLRSTELKRRSFSKSLLLREANDRDTQFVEIGANREPCIEARIPISVDTKKKVRIGNLKWTGRFIAPPCPRLSTVISRQSSRARLCRTACTTSPATRDSYQ